VTFAELNLLPKYSLQLGVPKFLLPAVSVVLWQRQFLRSFVDLSIVIPTASQFFHRLHHSIIQSTSTSCPDGTISTALVSIFSLCGYWGHHPIIPLHSQEIGLSSATNEIVISEQAVAMFLFAIWGGTQADQTRKPVLVMGIAVIAVADIRAVMKINMDCHQG
jgi:hypothetical protein